MGDTARNEVFDSLKEKLDHGYQLALQGELDAADAKLRTVHQEALGAGYPNIAVRSLLYQAYISDQRGTYQLGNKLINQCLALCAEHSINNDASGAYSALARTAILLGKLEDAEANLGQALMYAKLANDRTREADVYCLQGEAFRRRGLLRDALDYYTSAADLYAQRPSLLMVLHCRLAIHELALELGEAENARAAFAAAEQLADTTGAGRPLCAGYARRACMLVVLGDLTGAAASLEECTRFVDVKLDYDQELEIELAHGVLTTATNRLGEALERFARAKRMAQKMHNRFRLAEIRLEHAKALIAYGRLEHAQAVLLDTELAFEKFGARGFLARCHCCWTHYYLAVGNHPAAQSAFEQAWSLAEGLGDEAGQLLKGEIARAQADLDRSAVSAEPFRG